MGGRVAQLLAARNPDLVDRLVLACTSPGGPHAKERSPALRRKVALGGNTALRELFYTDAWAGKNSLLLGDPSMSPEEKTAHLRASNRHNAWDFLPLIKARTLVMHGDNDLMVPTSNAAIMADRIPNAILYLHQGRHGFFDEFADEVQPLLDEFLVDRDAAL
ncbi:hypothetical protein HKX48_007556 [Thoreauomyces humboldtii]|nr:hypothetical protein HKX48_007556 [Thoreauomyces humboldtii]